MPPIPLIRGRYIQSFLQMMDRQGVCPRPLLDRHGIPGAVLVDPDAVHPAHQLWAFAADAARHTGLVDLGLRAGWAGLASHGAFGARVAESPTLREATYLTDGPPRIEVVAKAARCSVRTFQRRLHEAGLSYSRLIQEVRLSAAAERLRAPGLKLVDIAFDAGYSDQANFTRAFRRWAGVPPSQFRRLSVQGAVGPPPQ